MSIDNTAKMNAAQDDIEFTGDPIVGGTDDLWLVRVKGMNDYICHEDNKDDVATFLATQFPELDVVSIHYPQAYVYYRVWLNVNQLTENGIHKYNVYRNQFIHIDITDLKVDIDSPGGFGGGYPGDEDDPDVPVDPTEDPEDPDPTDPIDEDEATLLVNITVKPWTYVLNPTVLQ
ncbi:MAG: fimbria major subunit [Rikenellaceae bacterium]|nr:fimbria major subunit [Rikenellaceae bacterium]